MFGIFYEHQLPRPWGPDSEYRLLNDSLEQIQLADQLGYHYAWEVEHHFLEEYSHSSAPEVFLGAASQRTSQIRLGHGIVQLTTNHPARVAERVSTLDLLSDGRVELGLGEGATTAELHPFGRRFRDKHEVWVDGLRALIPMFGDGPVEYHGRYFDFPRRNVIPKPRQKPHPPLWVACSQRETIEAAGRWGLGALGFQFVSEQEAHAWVAAYYNSFTRRQERLADYVTNPNIALVSGFMCCPTDEEANVKAEGWTFFAFALRWYATHKPGEGEQHDLWAEYEEFRKTPASRKMHAGGLIGSPETIRRKLRKFEGSHVDQVILLNQAGRNTHADICNSLELFAEEVMPEFVGRHEEQEAWKAAVLSGELELQELDTSQESIGRPRRRQPI
jgi:alkanesulfonate monooxygenase SsuD/methylene tetrahydromethanopterin reductase-like flavin-dependent oxidoreductase (luciferase family)